MKSLCVLLFVVLLGSVAVAQAPTYPFGPQPYVPSKVGRGYYFKPGTWPKGPFYDWKTGLLAVPVGAYRAVNVGEKQVIHYTKVEWDTYISVQPGTPIDPKFVYPNLALYGYVPLGDK